MEEDGEKIAGITPSELSAITHLLYFYERHLWNFIAPSAKRTKLIVEIQLLIVKVQLLASSKVGAFTPVEVGYIEAAISIFITQAKERVTQSESRDAVITSCVELREYLRQTFALSNGQYL
jgi:hypothetical protein